MTGKLLPQEATRGGGLQLLESQASQVMRLLLLHRSLRPASRALAPASVNSLPKFIGKRWDWKGGFPHLETKAEIMGGVVKFR